MNQLTESELERLIYALCDDSITDEEHDILQETLKGDPAARLLYIKQMEIHNLLSLESEDFVEKSTVVPIDKYLSKHRRKTAINAIAAAAVVLIGIVVSLHITSITTKQPTLSSINAAPHSEFKITHSDTQANDTDGDYLTNGSSLELHQGTIELKLASGVNSIVQAPAKFTLDNNENLQLEYGVAWFNVPSEAIGFTVTTPKMKVVDLGTEFGVSVDYRNIESDTIHLLKGSVEVSSRFGKKSSEVLTTADARMAHFTGNLTEVPLSEGAFLKTLPKELPYLHWSFDQPVSDGFTTNGTVPLATEIQVREGNITLESTLGIAGNAARFKGTGGLVTDWLGIDADRPRTISCWVRVPMHQPNGAIVGWGVPHKNASKWRITLNPENNQEGGVKGALRTEFGFGYIIGSTDLRDGKWHHVTSVYDGSGIGNADTIKLYVDGEPEEISAFVENFIYTRVNDSRSAPCAIGYGFNGEIDELHIYQGVLPADSIRAAYNKLNNDK